MRISHRHRFVFLAMPRTGSTSLRSVLDPYSDVISVHISEISAAFPFYHHISAAELKTAFLERGWDFNSYTRFCVVRNPYDRVVSLYHHALEFFHRPPGFRDYVMQLDPRNRLPTSLRCFICDDKNMELVNDILMYETLSETLPGYLGKFGIRITSQEIPFLNSSRERTDYRKYYDAELKQYVERLYAEDIERFGYRF